MNNMPIERLILATVYKGKFIMRYSKFLSVLVLILVSTAIHSQSLRQSEVAANEATRRLEEALGGNISGTNSPSQYMFQNSAVQLNVQISQGGTRPAWVTNPSAVYSRDRYISAVGFAANRSEAEKRAFGALVAFFGQSVRADLEVATIYSEAVTNGVINFSENTNVQDIIITAASLDKLIGAEIGYIWDDGRGTVNALAYIEKERAEIIYTELIRINQIKINELITMSIAERNTLDGFTRYKLAEKIANINENYASIVNLCGGSALLNFTTVNTLMLESQNIIKNISIDINVSSDYNNRVRDAFAKVINGEGFRTQGRINPYTLEINIKMNETRFPNNDRVFCRFTVNANLIERATGSVLLPFSISDREGHATFEEAKVRSYLMIEKIVAEKYPAVLKEYLESL